MWISCRWLSSSIFLSCLVSKIEEHYTALYADNGLFFSNEDSGTITIFCNEMGIFGVNLNNINLDNNFDEDDSDTIILSRLLAWHSKKYKTLKKE